MVSKNSSKTSLKKRKQKSVQTLQKEVAYLTQERASIKQDLESAKRELKKIKGRVLFTPESDVLCRTVLKYNAKMKKYKTMCRRMSVKINSSDKTIMRLSQDLRETDTAFKNCLSMLQFDAESDSLLNDHSDKNRNSSTGQNKDAFRFYERIQRILTEDAALRNDNHDLAQQISLHHSANKQLKQSVEDLWKIANESNSAIEKRELERRFIQERARTIQKFATDLRREHINLVQDARIVFGPKFEAMQSTLARKIANAVSFYQKRNSFTDERNQYKQMLREYELKLHQQTQQVSDVLSSQEKKIKQLQFERDAVLGELDAIQRSKTLKSETMLKTEERLEVSDSDSVSSSSSDTDTTP